MFMYLNFTLDITLDIFSGPYDGNNPWSRNTWINHQSYTFYTWSRYLDKFSTYHQPIRKPTVKLIITNFLWDIHCFYMKIYHSLVGSIFVEDPVRYGYYYDCNTIKLLLNYFTKFLSIFLKYLSPILLILI